MAADGEGAPTLLDVREEEARRLSKHSADSGGSDTSFGFFRPSEGKEASHPEPSSKLGGMQQGKDTDQKTARKRFRPSAVEVSLWSYTIFMSAVGRIPFCLFTLHLVSAMGFSMTSAAFTLALYCFGRLIGANLSGNFVGSVVMVLGTLCGAAGWLLILMFEHDVAFIVGSFLLGLTETISGVETMIKIEGMILSRTPAETQAVFRGQLISTNVGDSVAFLGGGILYQLRGIREVGYASLACTALCFLTLACVYARRRIYRQPLIRLGDILAEHQAQAPKNRKSRMSVAGGKAADFKKRVTQVRIEALELEVEDEEDTVRRTSFNARATRMSVRGSMVTEARRSQKMGSHPFLSSIVTSFFFNTMGVSTQSAVSALYWRNVWGKGPDFVGLLLALGEAMGVMILLVLSHPKVFNSRLTRAFGKPMNVLCSGFCMGLACFVVTLDNMYISAVGTICILGFNTCVQSFQSELIAVCAPSESFGVWISRCYMMKRLANGACIILSLVMYDMLGPQNSYRAVALWLCVYAGVLILLYGIWVVLPAQLWIEEVIVQRRSERERQASERAARTMSQIEADEGDAREGKAALEDSGSEPGSVLVNVEELAGHCKAAACEGAALDDSCAQSRGEPDEEPGYTSGWGQTLVYV